VLLKPGAAAAAFAAQHWAHLTPCADISMPNASRLPRYNKQQLLLLKNCLVTTMLLLLLLAVLLRT
jgi:hypothetical protein